MTKSTRGFTVIEILLVTVLLAFASVLFFVQKNNIEIIANDNTKKTAINALYYSLEEVYYPENKHYPQFINSENIRSVDPAIFVDPNGIKLGEAGSAYSYKPTDCTDGKCKNYTLEAMLENESDYTKTNRVE